MVSDKFRFVFVLPALTAIYFEESDFTHHLYFKNESDMVELKNLVDKEGLFFIQ
jgi:hypothetical protein